MPQTAGENMKKPSKKYTAAMEKVDRSKSYTSTEAIKLLKEVKFAKFDETCYFFSHFNSPRTALL